MERASEITVACIQMNPIFGEVELNIQTSLEKIKIAAQQGANFIVLPELCNTGYVFNTRKEAFSLAETVPDGPSVRAWCRAARDYNIHIVAGITEREENVLYNSAVLVGPDGYIGTYRKNHLWNEEKLFFEKGDLGFPIFDTEAGKIGILICYDMWFPEGFRYYATQGVDLVCVPTNWVPMPDQPANQMKMAVHVAMANAHCNSMFIACADRVGEERGQPFIGSSVIVNSNGWPVSGPASEDKEEILLASINLSEARVGKTRNRLNSVLQDRRTELYPV